MLPLRQLLRGVPVLGDPFVFPRKPMRYLQMGLEEKLEGQLDPWLCYYCGECSDQCPRDAEPGETMMSLRRWLTSRYDFTGISRLFYRSWRWELGRHPAGGAAHGDRLHAVRAVAGQPRRLRRARTPSCPARASTSSTGPWPACCWRSCSATPPGCGGSPWDATGRLPTSVGSYLSSLVDAARCTS